MKRNALPHHKFDNHTADGGYRLITGQGELVESQAMPVDVSLRRRIIDREWPRKR